MTTDIEQNEAEFDQFADDYDAELNKGLSLTGEAKEYFAEGRMRWLAGRMAKRGFRASRALDFGCGTGTSTPYFGEFLDVGEVIGVDPSEDSLKVARETYGHLPASFCRPSGFDGEGSVDLAFCNGVFHHIPVADRPEAVEFVFKALRPGGWFAFWENNAWNPATRYVMSRVPFDRDAILLFPHEAKRLLKAAGFGVIGVDYKFIFPSALAAFRPLERHLCKLPLGGQYLVLAEKPGGAKHPTT